MKLLHHKFTAEEWAARPQKEQLLHIAAELKRVSLGELRYGKGDPAVRSAYERALDLIDATYEDSRWKNRSGELLELRDAVGALYVGKSDPAIANALSRLLSRVGSTEDDLFGGVA